MKILITGSDGFIGKQLQQKLTSLGDEVIGFDLQQQLDITEKSDFDAIGAVDVALHLASKSFVPESFNNPYEYYRVNVFGTLNLLEYCRSRKVKKLIYFSSYVYGKPEYLPIDEQHPVRPHNPYARTKLMAEQLCYDYFAEGGIVPLIIRPFNVFGSGQNKSFLIPQIIADIREKDKALVVNDLEPKRDYLYVADLISACLAALKDYNFVKPEIVNLGSGVSYSVAEIIKIIKKISKIDKEVVSLNKRRPAEVMDCLANIKKANKLLSWEPKYSFEEGIRELFDAKR